MFETEIVELYEAGKIHSPVHLSGGNEDELIYLFSHIKEEDWVFSTHRNHYHALLKGVDREWLKNEILKNKSMHINSPEHRFITSSIVGGVLPIALGVALGNRLKNGRSHVWVFVGDMASEMGIFHECNKYAKGEDLQITFVVEDNGIGCYTPTDRVWRYTYERTFPHHGTGTWVNF